MPITDQLIGKCLTPLPHIPQLNEVFAYKFDEIHVGRAIRLDSNGPNNNIGFFEAILIDTGCRVFVDIEATEKRFQVTNAAKSIPPYAQFCKVDRGSAALRSLLQQKCFYRILGVEGYTLHIELLQTDTNPFLYFNERDNEQTFQKMFQHHDQPSLNNVNSPLRIERAYDVNIDMLRDHQNKLELEKCPIQFNNNMSDTQSHSEAQMNVLAESSQTSNNNIQIKCGNEKLDVMPNSNDNRPSGFMKYGRHFIRLSRTDDASNSKHCNDYGQENNPLDLNGEINGQQPNFAYGNKHTNGANDNQMNSDNVLDDHLHSSAKYDLCNGQLDSDSDSLIDSQVVHKKNYTNGYEKGDEPNGNNMDEQQQEYLINPNEKMYPLEIPVGSIMKLKSNKNLTQLLPKIGKTLEVTLLFSLDIENFFLDMDDESDEGYNIPLDELQIEINAADKNHMKITELPEIEEMLLGRYYDGQLCRVKVVGTLSEEHIKVLAVDYGNCFTVTTDELYRWDWSTNTIPFKGYHCRLDHVAKVMNIDTMAMQFFMTKYMGRQLQATVKEVLMNRELVIVDLYDDGVNIAEDLCNRNFAKWVDNINATDELIND